MLSGRVVYTNWHLILDDFVSDQRLSFRHAFWNFLFFRKRFYNIDIKKNWHYYDLDDREAVDKISRLTDCVVYADEGQDIFDSYEGTKMSKKKRKSLTRTRHLNKTLVIISQRPQAIAVTARANVEMFYRTEKVISWPFVYFRVVGTEEIDSNNMPIFEKGHRVDGYFASKKIFGAYNSWYLRAGIPKSQDVYFEAFDLSFKERLLLLWSLFVRQFSLKAKVASARSAPADAGGLIESASIKNGGGLNTNPVGESEGDDDIERDDQPELPF